MNGLEGSERIAKLVADWLRSIGKAAGRALWNTFWNGGMVGAIVVMAGVIIAVTYALGAVGASPAETDQTLNLVGGLALLLFLLRLFKYMLAPRGRT